MIFLKKPIFFILPIAILSLLIGMYVGLIRIGWQLPVWNGMPISHHGVIMVGSFLGSLICLERVVTLKSRLPILVPIVMLASMPIMLLQFSFFAYQMLILGSLGYVIISAKIAYQYKFASDYVILLGAIFQLIANLILYKTNSYPMAFSGWMLFLLFTIVGERLNLTRFLPVTKWDRIELYVWLGLLVISSALYHSGLAILVGISQIGTAQWLLRNDIALINSKKEGQFKFLGFSLIGAYFWLFLSGLISLQKHGNYFLYDALLHAFFVGFVLSMIMAHAPIIFPSILKINVKPYHPIFFVWLGGLHISLLMRIVGDFIQNNWLRKMGGLFNGLSFLVFLISMVYFIIQQKRKNDKSN
jgi:hypothetical protein